MGYLGPELVINKRPFIENDKPMGGFKEVELINVVDGDTAHFKIDGIDTKVRFLVVDTPEINPHEMPYSMSAKLYSTYILEHASKIYLQTDPSSDLYDDTPSKRLLAWIWADGELLNYNLVCLGYSKLKYVTSENLFYLNELKEALEFADTFNLRLHEGSD